MKKPFLHTTLRKQMELSINTDEAAEALRKLGAIVDSSEIDAMPFVIEAEDYHIEGLIQRWEGTESRIRFEGEITLTPFDQNLRNRIVAVSVGVIIAFCSGVFVMLITNPVILLMLPRSIDVFGTSGTFTFYIVCCVFALLIVFALIVGIFRLASIDPLAERRWDAQQALGKFAEALEEIKGEAQS